jgi:hypothetical protein
MQHTRLYPTLAALGACLAALAGAASAYASAPAAPARSAPAGYRILSKLFPAPAGAESGGSVRCPKSLVPIGGSVFASSSPDLRVNVSASFPFGPVWGGTVKNSSAVATTFSVTAICATRPQGYRVVTSAVVPNPPNTLSQATVKCPVGTMPLSGGGETSSSSTDVNMNSTFPSGRSWVLKEDNFGAATDSTIAALAVCAKVHGYRVVQGKSFAVVHGAEAGSFAACPKPTVPVGGGIVNHLNSVTAIFAGSFPSANEWDAFENNSTEVDIASSAVAVCASR